jgi:two-component system NtrC family sensor kinase
MSDAYKKAYDRERISRLAAEELLDKKTREVHSSIDMIQLQFNELMKQKKEADYLLAVARLTQNDKGLTSIVSGYLQASIEFISGTIGRYSYVKDSSVTSSPVIGTDQELPGFNIAVYNKIYALQARKIWNISELEDEKLEGLLERLGINRIGFVPVKSFGEVATVCEFYLSENVDFDSVLLDQCEVSAYQISSILEGNINKKKLEVSYLEVKKSHEKLKEAQSQLVHSEKMASLGQLAAGVAHEINNPIGFVMSNVGTLKEYSSIISRYISLANDLLNKSDAPECDALKQFDNDEDMKFIVNDINEIMVDCTDGLKRVEDIVASLKSFARSDEEEMSEFNINDCILNTIKVVWNEMKYKVTLHKVLGDNLPMAQGHEGQIGQVVMNILVNATHAIDDKGEIYILTNLSGNKIEVVIKDTGKGMSEAVQTKIFDPFFTTKGVSEGTGLGLSISYGIVESHGGSINVSSIEGEGTEFKILLPIVVTPLNRLSIFRRS